MSRHSGLPTSECECEAQVNFTAPSQKPGTGLPTPQFPVTSAILLQQHGTLCGKHAELDKSAVIVEDKTRGLWSHNRASIDAFLCVVANVHCVWFVVVCCCRQNDDDAIVI
jgi:hypothetical protein